MIQAFARGRRSIRGFLRGLRDFIAGALVARGGRFISAPHNKRRMKWLVCAPFPRAMNATVALLAGASVGDGLRRWRLECAGRNRDHGQLEGNRPGVTHDTDTNLDEPSLHTVTYRFIDDTVGRIFKPLKMIFTSCS